MLRDDMAVGLSRSEIKATATICKAILLPDKELSSFGTKMSEVQILSARLVEKGAVRRLFLLGRASVDLKGKRSEPTRDHLSAWIGRACLEARGACDAGESAFPGP